MRHRFDHELEVIKNLLRIASISLIFSLLSVAGRDFDLSLSLLDFYLCLSICHCRSLCRIRWSCQGGCEEIVRFLARVCNGCEKNEGQFYRRHRRRVLFTFVSVQFFSFTMVGYCCLVQGPYCNIIIPKFLVYYQSLG